MTRWSYIRPPRMRAIRKAAEENIRTRLSIALLLAIATTAATFGTAVGQWPTTCVELNDIVETHLGNYQNVGIYQRVFGDQAELACQADHRDDVRAVFAWAIRDDAESYETPADAPVTTGPIESDASEQSSTGASSYPFRNISFEIEVVGDQKCMSQTEQALALLRQITPSHYGIVNQYVGVIRCVSSGSGMDVWADPPTYLAGSVTRDAGKIWYAGTIAHDACHSKQYHDHLAANPIVPVPSHVFSGRHAEAMCLAVQLDVLRDLGASSHTLQHVQDIIDSEYWEVSYEDRYW